MTSRPLSLLEQWLEGVPNTNRDNNKTSVKKERADPSALPFPPPQTNATFLFTGSSSQTSFNPSQENTSASTDTKPFASSHLPHQQQSHLQDVKVKQEKTIDSQSIAGSYGWESIDGIAVPVLFRETEKLVAVRVVENKIISLYSNCLPWKVFSCINIRSYFVTEAEAKLLNEINSLHCDSYFGFDTFSPKDVVVCIQDVFTLRTFLETSKAIFTQGLYKSSSTPRMGFVNISDSFVVPFIVKSSQDCDGNTTDKKYVPQSMIEQTVAMIKVQKIAMDEWDVSYLKMLLIYAGMDHVSLTPDDVLCCLQDLEWDLNLSSLRIEECNPISSFSAGVKPILTKQTTSVSKPLLPSSSHQNHLSPLDALNDPWLRSSTASSPNTTLRSLHQVSNVDVGGIVLTAVNLKSYSAQQAVFVAEVVKNLCPGVSILTVHHILEKILQVKLYDYSRYEL